MCHIYGVNTILGCLLTGSHIVLLRQYNFHHYVQACAKIKATMLRMVPQTAVALVKDPTVSKHDLSSVHTIVCAGAVLPPEIITELQKMMKGVVLSQGYG